MIDIAETFMRMVDQRIRASSSVTEALGVCVERSPSGPGAMVQFRGSDVAVPVKVAGHVLLRAEQTCVLQKFGTEWIVMGAMGTPALGYGHRYGTGIADSTPSTSYVDISSMTSSHSVAFTKYHDNTAVEISYTAGGYVTTAPHEGRWGIRFVQEEGDVPYTPVDYNGPTVYWNVANMHLHNHVQFPVLTYWPAGRYVGTLRWRRLEGSASISTDGQDLYAVTVREYVDPAKTIL